MTTALELGTIEKVDIREVWPTEDGHFTPWLGENLHKLGTDLGLDLELVETEASVGAFRLDVHARDTGSQSDVVIENQFGQTDHSHLGQILTYAGGFDADVVVWIAENFRDEHREALDFLNHRTGEDTQFFGVELELWTIDGSRPAVNFNLVSTPNEWSKANARPTGGRREINRLFQEQLLEKLRECSLIERRGRVGIAPYRILEYPVAGVRYAVIWHQGSPGLEIIIDSPDRDWNLRLYQNLEQDREDIEESLTESGTDESFVWEELSGRRGSRMAIYRTGDMYQKREEWNELQQWMVRKYSLFKEVFGPRLAELVD